MKEYMLLDSTPVTEAEIQQALHRAHQIRSAAVWAFVQAALNVPSKIVRSLRKTKTLDGSGLVHS